MALVSPQDTKIEQKTSSLLIVIATFPVSFAVLTYVMLTSSWAKTGSLWPYAFIALEACFVSGMGFYFYLLWKYPGYVVVGKDSFSVRPGAKKTEKIYAYADVLYFESRLIKGKNGSYWKTRAITRGSPLPRHIDLPIFQSASSPRSKTNVVSGDADDLRVFKLLKAALESWQSKHGVPMQTRVTGGSNLIT